MYADRGSRRVSGSERRIRTHVRALRLSDDELHQLNIRAAAAGLTVGTYLRTVALGDAGPRARRRPIIERELLAKLLGQLGKMGSNLNQIAFAANRGDELDRIALRRGLADVASLRVAVLEVLGRAP